MKNAIVFTFLFCLLATTQLSAQHFGLRVGANATNVKYDFGRSEVETEGKTNLLIGAFLTLPVAGDFLAIQPEISYLKRGYEIPAQAIFNNATGRVNFAYVDLGALVRLNFGPNEGLGFYVGAGPYISYAVSGKTAATNNIEVDVDFSGGTFNRIGVQVVGVGGLTFGSTLKFFLEARYMGALTNLSVQEQISLKQYSIGINSGVMIPIGG